MVMAQKPIRDVINAQMYEYVQAMEWSSEVRASKIHNVGNVEKLVKLDFSRTSMRS